MKKMQKNLVLALIAMMILSIASVAYAEEPTLYIEVNQESEYVEQYNFEEQNAVIDGQIQIQVDGTVVNNGNTITNNVGLVDVNTGNIPSIRSEIAPEIAPEYAPAIRAEIALVPEIIPEASSRAWQVASTDATAALNLVAVAQEQTHSRAVPEIKPEIVAQTRDTVIVDGTVPLAAGIAVHTALLSSEITADAPHYEEGQIVTLSANARGGNGNYSYQWMIDRKDGNGFVALEGQNGASYRFTYSAAKLGFSWCVAVDAIA